MILDIPRGDGEPSLQQYASQAHQFVLGGESYAYWYGIEANKAVCHIWKWSRNDRNWTWNFPLTDELAAELRRRERIILT